MLRFAELTPDQKEKAIGHETVEFLKGILEGAIRFDDKANRDTLQRRIDRAFAKAERLHTPWFAHEIIMEDPYCAKRIKSMAAASAESALYTEANEHVIDGVVS